MTLSEIQAQVAREVVAVVERHAANTRAQNLLHEFLYEDQHDDIIWVFTQSLRVYRDRVVRGFDDLRLRHC